MRNLKAVLEELDIQYVQPIQPILLPNILPKGMLAAETSSNASLYQADIYNKAPVPSIRID